MADGKESAPHFAGMLDGCNGKGLRWNDAFRNGCQIKGYHHLFSYKFSNILLYFSRFLFILISVYCKMSELFCSVVSSGCYKFSKT